VSLSKSKFLGYTAVRLDCRLGGRRRNCRANGYTAGKRGSQYGEGGRLNAAPGAPKARDFARLRAARSGARQRAAGPLGQRHRRCLSGQRAGWQARVGMPVVIAPCPCRQPQPDVLPLESHRGITAKAGLCLPLAVLLRAAHAPSYWLCRVLGS
jgi:hypothetical protein